MKVIKRLIAAGRIVVSLMVVGVFVLQAATVSAAKKYPFYDPSVVATTCGSTTGSLSGTGNDEKVYFYLTSKGLSPVQAAGFMGNMQAESNFEPRLVEYGSTNSRGEISRPGQPSSLDDEVPPGVYGYGIIQWSGGRKAGLAEAAIKASVKPSDLGLQLDHVMSELTGSYYKPRAYDPLLAATTVEDATNIILENFEIPANIPVQRPIRLAFAKSILTRFGGSSTPTFDGGSPSGGCSSIADGSCPTAPIPEDQTIVVQGIRVHPCIGQEVDRIITLAKEKGINLGGGGYRSNESQIKTRIANGCGGSRIYDRGCIGTPRTAIPGKSNHEKGTAIDFTCDGRIVSRGSSCFEFLKDNTALKNLPEEPWHWSNNGG